MSNAFMERRERRIARYLELSAKAQAESNRLAETSFKMMDAIPMGQPILVGHHSEKRDRRFRERSWNMLGASVKAQEKAEYYRSRAENASRNQAISSDDPEASDKLTEKLARLEKRQATMKAANLIIRRAPKNIKTAEKLAALEGLGVKPETAVKLFEPDFCGRYGFPDYALTNNNANIRRIRERVAELAKAPTETIERDEGICTVIENACENRIQLVFSGKPPENVRDILKRNGFHWSPNNTAWQRQLNASGKAAARYAIDQIKRLESPEPSTPVAVMSDAEYKERMFRKTTFREFGVHLD